MYQEEVEPDVFEPLYNTTSPTVAGAGTDGYLPGVDSTGAAIGTDAKKGAIVLAPASPYTSFNGGSILLQLPSCYHLSVFLSAESSIRPALKVDLENWNLLTVPISNHSFSSHTTEPDNVLGRYRTSKMPADLNSTSSNL